MRAGLSTGQQQSQQSQQSRPQLATLNSLKADRQSGKSQGPGDKSKRDVPKSASSQSEQPNGKSLLSSVAAFRGTSMEEFCNWFYSSRREASTI